MISRRTSSVPKEDIFPRLLYHDSMYSQDCHRSSQAFGQRSQACRRHTQVLPGLLSALPGLSPTLPGAPRCTWRPLHRSSTLWDWTTLGSRSNNSQTLPEAPSDQNTFCWCGASLFLVVGPLPHPNISYCLSNFYFNSQLPYHLITLLVDITDQAK